MKIPKGMTETQVLEIIDKVIDRVYRRFIFSCFEADDIKQEARIIAIKGLDKYDGIRPLENFMAVHIRNRLCNFKRNNYIRIDKPCFKCPYNAYVKEEDKCTKYYCKDDCVLYKKWLVKNERRKNIISPIGLAYTVDDDEQNLHVNEDVGEKLDNTNIIKIIDDNISIKNRESWLKMKNGIKLSRIGENDVKLEINEIMIENNINIGEFDGS